MIMYVLPTFCLNASNSFFNLVFSSSQLHLSVRVEIEKNKIERVFCSKTTKVCFKGYPVISHMCNMSMYQKSMYLKSMSHIVSVLKVKGSKKSLPSKTHKYST